METGLIFLLFACINILQYSLGNFFDSPYTKVELLLMTALYFSFNKGWKKGMLIGAMAGFLRDIYSLHPLGYNMIAYGFVCAVGGVLHEVIYFDTMLISVVFVGIASFTIEAFHLARNYSYLTFSLLRAAKAIAISSALNMFISPFYYGFFNKVKRALQKNILFFYSKN